VPLAFFARLKFKVSCKMKLNEEKTGFNNNLRFLAAGITKLTLTHQ
jgi:hypothetical protein